MFVRKRIGTAAGHLVLLAEETVVKDVDRFY
jgi:hypothetical protein